MFTDKIGIKGHVTAVVRGPDGLIKTFSAHPLISWMPLSWQKKVSKISKNLTYTGQPMKVTNHNIVTDEGDAMVADLLQETPERDKVDGTTGYIEVGTGFTSESKTATSCTTPTDSPELLDATYPQTKGAWGAANDNVIVYVVTFEAADLDATGIDEAALLNGGTATAADALAYAQITPAVNVTIADTLEVTWELTFTGS